jgi:hypothetical protein
MATPRKIDLDFIKELARENGGECLSTTYRGVLEKYEFCCGKCGRQWTAQAAGLVYRGSFCSPCARKTAFDHRKVGIEVVRELVASKRGVLHSSTYENNRAKLDLECSEGHRWKACYDKLQGGRWCPECGRRKTAAALSYSLEEMQVIAKTFGGECLSSTYRGIFEPLEWRCANGHEFQRQPALLTKTNPLARTWCPYCSGTNHTENMCRAVVEAAYGRAFPNVFPGDWLRNVRGRKMQLDGYSAELALAFEYHGQQHFEVVEIFNDEQMLETRQVDDAAKVRRCREHGIRLVVIGPVRSAGMDMDLIEEHVRGAFRDAGVPLPPVDTVVLQEKASYYSRSKLQELREIAQKRGGELLSTVYKTMNTPLRWRCACGNVWQATGGSVVYGGSWCPDCAGCTLKTIEEMHALAVSKGGRCLSTEYTNTRTLLQWECGECENKWSSMPTNVQRGTWCPKCSANKRGEDARERLVAVVAAKGGRLMSAVPNGTKSRVSVQCAVGHMWSAPVEGLLYSGSWCRRCAIDKTSQECLERLKACVAAKGGSFTGAFENVRSRLKFTCARAHSWETIPTLVLGGAWCLECHRENERQEGQRRIEAVAAERGGRVLGTYLNARTKIALSCAQQHRWSAVPDSVVRAGTWCGECARGSQPPKSGTLSSAVDR